MSMDEFSLWSIAPYLPLQSHQGSLRWMPAVDHILRGMARGPNTSKVETAVALSDRLDDIRSENGDSRPLPSQVARGLLLFCAELENSAEFFEFTIPCVARLALQLPSLLEQHERETCKSVRLRVLSPEQSGIVLLHQQLIAALLACAFLCLYPEEPSRRKMGLVNINFDGLYKGILNTRKSNVQKLLCLVHYFNRVGKSIPGGTISFERKVLPSKECLLADTPDTTGGSFWSDSKRPLSDAKVLASGGIKDAGADYLQVDFANEQLGGGALRSGCLQEEIYFMVCPECIVGMLFLPTMTDNESIEIIGAETYSQYTGYGRTFSFAGNHTDNTPRDSWGRRKSCIVAIDALCLPGESQFEDELMIRELSKAYCGFSTHTALCAYGESSELGDSDGDAILGEASSAVLNNEDSQLSVSNSGSNYVVGLDSDATNNDVSFLNGDEDMGDLNRKTSSPQPKTCNIHQKLLGVATGNWGSGAFGGNLQLKSLLQWLAASQAGCSVMLYYSFGDPRSQRLQEVIDWIRKEGWCVSELWSVVRGYGTQRLNQQVKSEIFEWILPISVKLDREAEGSIPAFTKETGDDSRLRLGERGLLES